eukprot:s831_g8.t1
MFPHQVRTSVNCAGKIPASLPWHPFVQREHLQRDLGRLLFWTFSKGTGLNNTAMTSRISLKSCTKNSRYRFFSMFSPRPHGTGDQKLYTVVHFKAKKKIKHWFHHPKAQKHMCLHHTSSPRGGFQMFILDSHLTRTIQPGPKWATREGGDGLDTKNHGPCTLEPLEAGRFTPHLKALNRKSDSFLQVFEVGLSQLFWHFATATGGLRHRLMVGDLSKSPSFNGHVRQYMVHLQLPREVPGELPPVSVSMEMGIQLPGYNSRLYMVLAATVNGGANDQNLKGTCNAQTGLELCSTSNRTLLPLRMLVIAPSSETYQAHLNTWNAVLSRQS